jgi:hypothetical protein
MVSVSSPTGLPVCSFFLCVPPNLLLSQHQEMAKKKGRHKQPGRKKACKIDQGPDLVLGPFLKTLAGCGRSSWVPWSMFNS